MNLILKLLSVLFVIFVITISTYMVSAEINISEVKPPVAGDVGEIETMIQALIGVLNAIGSGISVIILIAIGIKIMTSSVEERAEYKSAAIPYLIGAFILFAAPKLVQIIYDVSTKLNWNKWHIDILEKRILWLEILKRLVTYF